ncbi:MAG: hypothetical protein ACM336_02265 [Acidobacteriota bacterium]
MNIALFRVLWSATLKPLPYHGADRLFQAGSFDGQLCRVAGVVPSRVSRHRHVGFQAETGELLSARRRQGAARFASDSSPARPLLTLRCSKAATVWSYDRILLIPSGTI